MKNTRVFYLKIFSFLEVKFSIYLNRRVFVMAPSKAFFSTEKYCYFAYISYSRLLLSQIPRTLRNTLRYPYLDILVLRK